MKTLKYLFTGILVVLALTACTSQTVLVVPPNYGIVISLSDTEKQATGNNFDEGELLNVTQQQITLAKCAANSVDYCPDKIVVEVQGSPESRIYSKDSVSGTAASNQALCFEANGANGCIDFSVTAIVERKDAKCYANKMGVKPFGDTEESRFHFMATPLATALDTRVIQIASTEFAKVVAKTSPLTLAIDKFTLFDGVTETIKINVHDQTCITLTNIGINNGIQWDSAEIQNQINQATVLANQLELMSQKNELLKQQTQALLDRTQLVEKEYGLTAALEFMKIQTEQMKIEKWDGNSWLPFLSPVDGNPATPEAVVTTVNP